MAYPNTEHVHKLLEPIITALWNLGFPIYNSSNHNPFHQVIDAENCVALGLPDYCQIIKKPMNLTYIKRKVNNKSYESILRSFRKMLI